MFCFPAELLTYPDVLRLGQHILIFQPRPPGLTISLLHSWALQLDDVRWYWYGMFALHACHHPAKSHCKTSTEVPYNGHELFTLSSFGAPVQRTLPCKFPASQSKLFAHTPVHDWHDETVSKLTIATKKSTHISCATATRRLQKNTLNVTIKK